MLVVIGILIALEVDNWNQERLQKERYQFGIEKVYNRILADFFYWETYQDRAEYHLKVLDSLLVTPTSVPPNRIRGNLLILDELIRDWYVDGDYYLDYLEFFPTDSLQFETLERLRLYYYDSWENIRTLYIPEEEEGIKKFLQKENIPICDFQLRGSFNKFIKECAEQPFSSEYYGALAELISTRKVRSILHLHQSRCRDLLAKEFMPGSQVLENLEKSFDFLNRDIKNLGIIGSGTLQNTSIKKVKMNPVSNQSLIWECNTTFKEGWIRFQAKRQEFSWGIGELNNNKLIFGGPNIPVKAGKYNVVVNLEEKIFELNPL